MSKRRAWFFDRFRSRAEKIGKDKKKTGRILDAATKKADKRKGAIGKLVDELAALIRMVRAHVSGSYREAPWQSIVLALGTIIYFLSPVDAIPDTIPFVGLMDDATLISWTIRSIRGDIDSFLSWERQQKADNREAQTDAEPETV
jgi:uncharacterized membrane protein YkvA (DUF1232 family)